MRSKYIPKRPDVPDHAMRDIPQRTASVLLCGSILVLTRAASSLYFPGKNRVITRQSASCPSSIAGQSCAPPEFLMPLQLTMTLVIRSLFSWPDMYSGIGRAYANMWRALVTSGFCVNLSRLAVNATKVTGSPQRRRINTYRAGETSHG